MDIRVLKYFLAVAREGSITKAAQALHITQPTLSRQIMDLEQELGTTLFTRGKRRLALTDSGILFQQRAREIVPLMEKTQRDLAQCNNLVGGCIAIGCVESSISPMVSDIILQFSAQYPRVRYDIYSANGDDIRDKLDGGIIDIGILIEPIETAKYDFVQLACRETWGVIMRRDDPLAERESIAVEEITALPLILSRRQIVMDEITGWLETPYDQLNVIATHNLLSNSLPLVERGMGYVVSIRGAYELRPSAMLHFVPFAPTRSSGHVLAWKKNRILTTATQLFTRHIQCNLGMKNNKI